MTRVSIVIPTYNAESKLHLCLSSLDRLRSEISEFEVVFVDDCSSDLTFDRLSEFSSSRDWCVLHRLQSNSGSPSEPRNYGVGFAKGEFVYFLDIDDEIIPDGFIQALELGERESSDVIRTPLIANKGGDPFEMNRVPSWSSSASKAELISKIIQNQSTNCAAFFSKRLISESKIVWDKTLRVGEDTVFLSQCLVNARTISYSDHPTNVYNNVIVEGAQSSTQQYSDRELENHLIVWRRVSGILATEGIDYFDLRGQVALQNVLSSLIRYNEGGISKTNFDELRSFLKGHKKAVDRFNYSPRLASILTALLDGDFPLFTRECKLRLLIAGYDLKFIVPSINFLTPWFEVRIDEWRGHDTHDVQQSHELLEWADVIHCEWMLGNAVWYSKHKRFDQTLVIRCHLFEIGRDFGDSLIRENVDRIICVSLPTLEDMQKRFQFDRASLRMLPNFIDVDSYRRSEDPDRCFNLGIVGILPARKGFLKSLQILSSLVENNSNYNLTIFGKNPEDLSWVKNNKTEMEYFEECSEFIKANGLQSRVKKSGWVDTKEALADIGVVLSVSDFESFHVAPAEAFAAGNVGLFLPWEGVEFIYPTEFIKSSIPEMVQTILSFQSPKAFQDLADRGREFVRANFDSRVVATEYFGIVREALK